MNSACITGLLKWAWPNKRPVVRHMVRYLTLFVAALVASTGTAAAEPIQTRTRTDSGVPLDEIIRINLGGTILHVPAGYLWTGPQQNARNRVNEQSELAFDFWMPSRRHLETNPLSYAGFQPKEFGRQPPPADSYTVRVRQFQFVESDGTGYVSPE